MNHAFLATLLALLSSPAFASTQDVHDRVGRYFVEVKMNSDLTVSLRRCDTLNPQDPCTQLGPKDRYGAVSLVKASNRLHSRGGWTLGIEIVGAILVIILLIVTGGFAILITGIAGTYGISSSGILIGLSVLAGGGGTALVAKSIDDLNPSHQWDKAKTISSRVITDEDVSAEEMGFEGIDDFTRKLDEALRDSVED